MAITDSQALKKAEIEGYIKRWKNTSYVIYAAICLDVLSPLRRVPLSTQKEKHNPVKSVRRIQEFNWTTTKLKLLIGKSLEIEGGNMTHYKRMMSKIELRDDGKRYYQSIKLSRFNAHNDGVPNLTKILEIRVPSNP